jgi:hypothetical protein
MTYPAGRSGQSWPDVTSPPQVSASARLAGRRDGASLSRRSVSWNHRVRAGSLRPLFPCGDGVAWIPLGQETLGESGIMF